SGEFERHKRSSSRCTSVPTCRLVSVTQSNGGCGSSTSTTSSALASSGGGLGGALQPSGKRLSSCCGGSSAGVLDCADGMACSNSGATACHNIRSIAPRDG